MGMVIPRWRLLALLGFFLSLAVTQQLLVNVSRVPNVYELIAPINQARQQSRNIHHPFSTNTLQLTRFEHNHTIQTLVVSSHKEGVLVGMGTTAFIPCPVPSYDITSLELRYGKTVFQTLRVEQLELQAGPVIVGYFNVTKENWMEWIIQPTTNTTRHSLLLTVIDNVLKTQHQLPVISDPANSILHNNNNGHHHFLSAMTTIRKQYRQYNGLSKVIMNGSKPLSWSDNEVLHRLHHWLNFHRKVGVQHFYIVDNERDSSKPNLLLDDDNDITYIRAPHIPYDGWRCYSDEHTTTPKMSFTVVGQVILENSILHMAHTEWLMFGDLDEFFVPGDLYNRNLSQLIQYYSDMHCEGEKNISCVPLKEQQQSSNNKCHDIFSMKFLPQIMSPNNTRLFEIVFRYKPIVRPALTASLSIHYSLPTNEEEEKLCSTTIPPRDAWLAHYNQRGAKLGGTYNWSELLSNIFEHSKDLRIS